MSLLLERLKPSVRIRTLFTLGIGLMLFVSVGAVLAFQQYSARQQLVRDLAREFDLTIDTLVRRVDSHMSAAEVQLRYLRDLLQADPALGNETGRLALAMRAALSATPQVSAIAFMRADSSSVRLERTKPTVILNDLDGRSEIVSLLALAQERGRLGPELKWSDPLYSPNLGRTIIVRRQAVWDEEKFVGLLFAAVDLTALSWFSQELSAALSRRVFVLYGRERVLAHPTILNSAAVGSEANPLPTLAEIDDVSLRRIWENGAGTLISQAQMKRSRGHYLGHFGDWLVFVYGETKLYGSLPFTVGFHFDSGAGVSQVMKFWIGLAIGILMMLVFVLLGMRIANAVAVPIQRMTNTASSVGRLELAEVEAMPSSRIFELDQAGRAFNAMINGLRLTQKYAPRQLVERIVRQGDAEIEATQRDITILFADMVGFTERAQHMAPGETAEFLNDYFKLIGECIETNGGTIDKYIGDGLLAFWGAPDNNDKHADGALSAAIAIKHAVDEFNDQTFGHETSNVQVRIGIHTGSALVGNIGAPGKVDYTAVGDAVNIASRIENLARNYMMGSVSVLITEATIKSTTYNHACELIGLRDLPRTNRQIVLYRLAFDETRD